jgi:hypothetical protein
LHAEWMQRRAAAGLAAPMVRVAVRVRWAAAPAAAQPSTASSSSSSSSSSDGEWLVSAVGEGKCHAHGSALEYFGCSASATESQWELHSLPLEASSFSQGGCWRRLDRRTLRPHKAVISALPSGTALLQLGLWCDESPPTSRADERCPWGATDLMDEQQPGTASGHSDHPSGAQGRRSPTTLADDDDDARQATLRALLPRTDRERIMGLAPVRAAAEALAG